MDKETPPTHDAAPQSPGALQTLDDILAATDIETVWALITAYFRDLGFGEVVYGYSPDSQGLQLGAVEDMLLLSTLERGFLQELVAERHYARSVTFTWALTHVGIASFSMTPAKAGLKNFSYTPETLAFYARHEVETGFSIGFAPVRAHGRGVMTVLGAPGIRQGRVDAILQARRREIFVVATVAHRSMVTLPYASARRLTERQREVLEWLAQGKTVADVSCIMGIATPTVEKHLRLAREALGVETTAHALVKATFLNQMFPPPARSAPDRAG